MTWKALILAAALTVPAGAAFAQPGGERGPGARFDALDANKDGQLTRAEVLAERLEHFAKIDANKDGAITEAELAAMAEKRAKKQKRDGGGKGFLAMDANGDGKVTKAEIEAAPLPMFDRYDADKNGVLTKGELPTRRKAP